MRQRALPNACKETGSHTRARSYKIFCRIKKRPPVRARIAASEFSVPYHLTNSEQRYTAKLAFPRKKGEEGKTRCAAASNVEQSNGVALLGKINYITSELYLLSAGEGGKGGAGEREREREGRESRQTPL